MLEETSPQETNQTIRNPSNLVIFQECATCHVNYEFVNDYWELDGDAECVFCVNNEDSPFKELEYVTLEDLDKYIPKRIQDCFSKIDEEIPVQPTIVQEEKPKAKHKKKPKDKKDS